MIRVEVRRIGTDEPLASREFTNKRDADRYYNSQIPVASRFGAYVKQIERNDNEQSSKH